MSALVESTLEQQLQDAMTDCGDGLSMVPAGTGFASSYQRTVPVVTVMKRSRQFVG